MEKQQNLCRRVVRILSPLHCFSGISPYKCKCKSRCKQCYIRLIQKHNLGTHMQKQQNLSKRVFRQIIVPPDWIEGTSPMLPNENINANSAILDLYKNTTWGHTNRDKNKLASLEATLVRNCAHSLTHSLTGARCRATSVAKNPQKSGQIIVPPRLLERYLPLYVKMKFQMQNCNIRFVQKHNFGTHK